MKRVVLCVASLCVVFNAHADIFVSPSSIYFFQVEVNGYGDTRSASVRNSGREDVRVSVSNTCFGDFHVSDFCGLTMSPGQSCSIQVRFSPRRVGHQSCSIWIRDDSGGSQSLNVSGEGVDRF